MIYHTYAPPAPLSGFVDLFWLYQDSAPAHAQERVLPSGSMQLIFNLREDAIRVYDRRQTDKFERFRGCIISGAQSEFTVIDTASQASIIGVCFKPGGAVPFLPLPAHELKNAHASLDTIWGTSAVDLRDQLLEAAAPCDQFHILEQALLARARRLVRRPAIAYALAALQAVPHMQTVGDVVEQIGISPRRFIEIFQDEVGLTPKLFSRIQRFQHALRLLETGRHVGWADVALACGYFDQAHCIRDFRAFSGLNPSAYLRRRGAHCNHVPLDG